MPSTSLKRSIEAYCNRNGVVIPPGFGRNAPSRYVVIRRDSNSPKLVAKTWFNQADVVYYATNTLVPELGPNFDEVVEILDFKEGQILRHKGGGKLVGRGSFDL
jgi:hypothetical protein